MARKTRETTLPSPYLKRVWLPDDADIERERYPFNLPIVHTGGLDISFSQPVTILVGENGTGKSTLLEAIAASAGFSDTGGAVGMAAVASSELSGADGGMLGQAMRAAWLPQVKRGWFFRAETFFSVSRYLDDAAHDAGMIGPRFLAVSHGEGFLAFFEERLNEQGVYIFDEPESALSPARQFDFLKILWRIQRTGRSQVIMATHSPILMALPGADLRHLNRFGIAPVALEDTDHFRLYREFVNYPRETVEAMIE